MVKDLSLGVLRYGLPHHKVNPPMPRGEMFGITKRPSRLKVDV